MPAPRASASNRGKRTPSTAGARAATTVNQRANSAVAKPSLPASKKRKRQPVGPSLDEDDIEEVKEEDVEAEATQTKDEIADEVAVEEQGVTADESTTAVKQEEKAATSHIGAGSSKEQQIELDEGDEEDNLSLSSSDLEQDPLLEEGQEDADSPFDELALPLRLYIGTYTGSLYALESLHTLRHLLTSPPLPPAEPHSAASTGRPASSFYTLFNTDAHRASIHALACSPQGSHLVSSGVDEVVQLYRLEGERRHVGSLHRHYASVNQLLFPSSHTFLSASDDGTVAVFSSVHQWEMVKRLSTAGTAGVVSMSLHPSHRVLLTSSSDGVVRMWDMVRGVEATRRRVKFEHPSVTAGGSGHVREEVRVQWEEAGKGYVMVRGKVLTVYDEQGAVHRVVHADIRVLSFLFIAPSLLVAGCEDCSLRCWDGHTGEQLWVQRHHTARVRCLDYLRLPDQQLLLVSASTDGQVWVWRGQSDGGVRSGVERVGGAKSEARITAVCCGVRWDARRPQYKDSAAVTAAQAQMEGETADEEVEEKTAAANGEMGNKLRVVTNSRKQKSSEKKQEARGRKPQQPRSVPAAAREESKEHNTVEGAKHKQKKRRQQVNKQQHNSDGAQVAVNNHGTEAAGRTISTRGGLTVANHKRRAR